MTTTHPHETRVHETAAESSRLPRLSRYTIERPALFDRLDRALREQATIVRAPAGYGKTSLVRKWLDRTDDANRPSATWVDFDLFGHQMSAHLRPQATEAARDGKVDGVAVPIPHFGAVLLMDEWERLAARLEARDDIDWLERLMVRFKGEPGEQATLFIRDPSGNALEFKGFRSLEQVFAH